MADDDIFTRVGKFARGAVDKLGPIASPLSGPLPVLGKFARDLNLPETARYFDVPAGHLLSGAAGVAAAPTSLYTLINAAANAAPTAVGGGGGGFIEGLSTPFLPGSQTAMDTSAAISKAADAAGSGLAGETLQPGLTSDNDLPNKIGTFGSIAATAFPAPVSVVSKIEKGIKAIDTGVKYLDTTLKLGARGLEAMLPFTMTGGKAGVAANVGVGAAITSGFDLLLDDYKQRLDKADAASPRVSDVITRGAQDTVTGTQVLKAASAPFQMPTPVPQESDADWYKGAALAGLTTLAWLNRATIRNMAGKVTDKLKSVPGELEAGVSYKLAPVMGAMKDIPGSPVTGQMMAAQVNKYANQGSQQTMLSMVKRDGVFPDAPKLKIEPMQAHVDAMKDLGPDGVNQLGMRLAAYKEMTNRFVLAAEENQQFKRLMDQRLMMNDPNHPNVRRWNEPELLKFISDPQNAALLRGTAVIKREGLVDVDTQVLARHVEELLKDPAQAAAMQRIAETNRTTSDYIGNHLRIWSPSELRTITSKNPVYLPTELDSGSHMQQRVRGEKTGSDQVRNPLAEHEAYMDEVLTSAWTMHARRTGVERLKLQASQGDPFARAALGREHPAWNDAMRDTLIPYRDVSGNQKYINVKDPLLAASLRMESPVMMRGMFGFLQDMRVVAQSATTRTLGLLAGLPFAPTIAAMNTDVIMATRPKGTRFGMIDSLLQNNGLPSLKYDPSAVVQVADAALRDAGSLLTRNFAEMLETSLRRNGYLSQILGPQTVKAIADSSRAKWEGSVTYDMMKRGDGHAFGQMNTDSYGAAKRTWLQNLQAQLQTQSPAAVRETIRAAKGTWDFLEGIQQVIAGSPTSAFYRQNKGKIPDDVLSMHTRNVAIDASKVPLVHSEYQGVPRALSAAHHAAISTAPYYNITAQSIAYLFKRIKQDPVGTAAGIAAVTVIPNLFGMSWNASLGPEYVDYQFNVRDNNKQASSRYFGFPGRPPEHGIEIPIDNLFGMFHVAAQEVLGSVMGLQDGSIFHPENNQARLRLVQLAGRRATENYWAAADRALSVQLPPAAAIAAPVTLGAGIEPVGPQAVRYAVTKGDAGRSMLHVPTLNRTAGFTGDPKSQLQDTHVFGFTFDDQFAQMLRGALMGAGDAIAKQIATLGQNNRAGNSVGAKLQDAGENWALGASDRLRPISGMLWSNNPKLLTDGTANKELGDKIHGVVDAQHALDAYKKYGYIGARTRGFEPTPGQPGQLPPDPQMLEVIEQGAAFSRELNTRYKGPVRDLYQQIAEIQASAKYSPVEKRDQVNSRVRQIHEQQKDALEKFYLFEYNLSKRYGRKIDFSNLDPSKPMAQLPPY